MEDAGEYPDIVIGCAGGGSNFAGLAFPFMRDRLVSGKKTRFIAAEPEACPSLTKGEYRYDFGDTAGMTPLVKMYTLGHTFIPEGIHAGGLRYHGMANLICELYDQGYMEARAYHQNSVFEAALQFTRTEAIVPAPESSHAIRAAIDEALACKQSGDKKVILFNLSGHGYFDMTAYDNYLSGKLQDFAYPETKVREAMTHVPVIA
jgi:tryptophan synthase beta chain